MRRQQNSTVYTNWIIVIMAGMFLFVGQAFGQFMVEPMLLELTPRPGELVRQELRLWNNNEKQTQTIYFSVIELGQSEEGVWEPNLPESGSDTLKKFSCREWIKFDANSIDVKPLSIRTMGFNVKAPPGIRGFYCAAILASIKAPPDAKGVALTIQFVIPTLVQMQGQPVRHMVELTDAGMEYHEPTEENPKTTSVSMSIANSGELLSPEVFRESQAFH